MVSGHGGFQRLPGVIFMKTNSPLPPRTHSHASAKYAEESRRVRDEVKWRERLKARDEDKWGGIKLS